MYAYQFYKRQGENYLENITWPALAKKIFIVSACEVANFSKPCIIPDCLLLQEKPQLNMFKVKLGLLVVYLLLLESALISSTTAFRVWKDRNVTKTKVLILGGGLSGSLPLKPFWITTSRIFIFSRAKITLEGEFMQPCLKGLPSTREQIGFTLWMGSFQHVFWSGKPIKAWKEFGVITLISSSG